MRFRKLAVAITAFSLVAISESKSVFAEISLTGYTYQLMTNDDCKPWPPNDTYQPLRDVTVQVFRQGGFRIMKSNETGHFDIKVPNGKPFFVLFYGGQDRVPELQQLAGKDGVKDEVHITMLTICQYKKIWGDRAPLRDKLRWIINELSLMGPEATQAKMKIEEILQSLG
jgi:hypothetical protein